MRKMRLKNELADLLTGKKSEAALFVKHVTPGVYEHEGKTYDRTAIDDMAVGYKMLIVYHCPEAQGSDMESKQGVIDVQADSPETFEMLKALRGK